MNEFLFECGCGHKSEISNYLDAAEHYVLCQQTTWWQVSCTVCNKAQKIIDQPTKELGEFVMLWCAFHLSQCHKMSHQQMMKNLWNSTKRHERFLMGHKDDIH